MSELRFVHLLAQYLRLLSRLTDHTERVSQLDIQALINGTIAEATKCGAAAITEASAYLYVTSPSTTPSIAVIVAIVATARKSPR